MNNEEQLKQTIKDLTKRVSLLEEENKKLRFSGIIPLDFERALIGRGFVKADQVIVSGQAQLTVGGEAFIPLDVKLNSIAYATYADGTGSDIGSIIIDDSIVAPNTIQLYLNGIGTKIVYWVVFKTADKNE